MPGLERCLRPWPVDDDKQSRHMDLSELEPELFLSSCSSFWAWDSCWIDKFRSNSSSTCSSCSLKDLLICWISAFWSLIWLSNFSNRSFNLYLFKIKIYSKAFAFISFEKELQLIQEILLVICWIDKKNSYLIKLR